MLRGAKALAAVSLVLGLSLNLSTYALAAASITQAPVQSAGISVSPTQKTLTLNSGLIEVNSDLTLHNGSPYTIHASIAAKDLTQIYDNGDQTFGQAGLPVGKYTLANYVELPNGNQVTVGPGQDLAVPVVIHNRADLTPGGHYGALVVTTQSADGSGTNPVSIHQNILSFLFVQKLGGEHVGMQLQSFTIDKHATIPQSASLAFKSTGNVYVIPRGYVEVVSSSGTVVAKGIINSDSELVLPGTTRTIDTVFTLVRGARIPTGSYTVIAHYRYDGNPAYVTRTITVSVAHNASHIGVIVAAALLLVLFIAIILVRRALVSRSPNLS